MAHKRPTPDTTLRATAGRAPLSWPLRKGELAKSAVASGCSAKPMRIFSTMSCSLS